MDSLEQAEEIVREFIQKRWSVSLEIRAMEKGTDEWIATGVFTLKEGTKHFKIVVDSVEGKIKSYNYDYEEEERALLSDMTDEQLNFLQMVLWIMSDESHYRIKRLLKITKELSRKVEEKKGEEPREG